MSNDKVAATFHPDEEDPLDEPPAQVQHMSPEDAPVPHAHMDEH